MSELVEDLELWLDQPAYVDTTARGRELERASWLIGRAHDEIVALRDRDRSSDVRAVYLQRAARREGAEEMRERAADQAHLVWGDGQIAASIRALPLTPEGD